MAKFTAPDGSSLTVDGTRVIRARRTIAGERGDENGDARTRIDWAIMSLLLEPVDQVAALVKAELPSFTALTSRDGSKIWFNAKAAVGPLPLTPNREVGNVRSSIKIMNYRQYVTETPDEVRAVLEAAGGKPV
jgi:hypothetical protein